MQSLAISAQMSSAFSYEHPYAVLARNIYIWLVPLMSAILLVRPVAKKSNFSLEIEFFALKIVFFRIKLPKNGINPPKIIIFALKMAFLNAKIKKIFLIFDNFYIFSLHLLEMALLCCPQNGYDVR